MRAFAITITATSNPMLPVEGHLSLDKSLPTSGRQSHNAIVPAHLRLFRVVEDASDYAVAALWSPEAIVQLDGFPRAVVHLAPPEDPHRRNLFI